MLEAAVVVSDNMQAVVNTSHDMLDGAAYTYRTGWEAMHRRHSTLQNQHFSGIEDTLMVRASELANDMKVAQTSLFLRPPENLYTLESHHMVNGPRPAHQMVHHLYAPMAPEHNSFEHSAAHMQAAMLAQQHHQDQQQHAAATAAAAAAAAAAARMNYSGYPSVSAYGSTSISVQASVSPTCMSHSLSPPHYTVSHINELDYDPRELEAFSERFKQRRIKLGVTQADVGRALGNLKLPGVGSLSQSTICRFESLTLSHNNMIALKPVLQAWLEEAERQAAERQKNIDIYGESADKKRKRTSITDAEKRSLEAYFTVQPRPSSEKIAQIAEKLNLKKNVVRVWFCNQRQKQKRMKFASPTQLMSYATAQT